MGSILSKIAEMEEEERIKKEEKPKEKRKRIVHKRTHTRRVRK